MTKALPHPFRPIEEFFEEFPIERTSVLLKVRHVRQAQRETAFRYCVDEFALKSIIVFSGSSDDELCFAKVEPGGCFIYDPDFEAYWKDVCTKNLARATLLFLGIPAVLLRKIIVPVIYAKVIMMEKLS